MFSRRFVFRMCVRLFFCSSLRFLFDFTENKLNACTFFPFAFLTVFVFTSCSSPGSTLTNTQLEIHRNFFFAISPPVHDRLFLSHEKCVFVYIFFCRVLFAYIIDGMFLSIRLAPDAFTQKLYTKIHNWNFFFGEAVLNK